MEKFIEVCSTMGSIDEARKISRALVEQKLVACAQIIPWIESVYLWDGKMETGQESKIILKTASALVEKVKEVILASSSYDVPEITVFEILDGNKEYFDWMRQTLQK